MSHEIEFLQCSSNYFQRMQNVERDNIAWFLAFATHFEIQNRWTGWQFYVPIISINNNNRDVYHCSAVLKKTELKNKKKWIWCNLLSFEISFLAKIQIVNEFHCERFLNPKSTTVTGNR